MTKSQDNQSPKSETEGNPVENLLADIKTKLEENGRILAALDDRITVLENRPVNSVTPEMISEMLEATPFVADFRAFREKWRH